MIRNRRHGMVENLEANSNNVSKPITPSLRFTCDCGSICTDGDACGSHGERACSSCTMQLGCHPLPASEPSPPPNMAEDPLRHTTRDGLSYNNYDGAGESIFFSFVIKADNVRLFTRLRCPVFGSQTGCYRFRGVTFEAGV